MQNKNLDGRASLILADGSIYEATGSKEFNDNVMNSDTGTITTWLKFENKNNKLFPGGLVRVELSSDEERFIVIPQTAVIAGSDGDYVYVVENNKAHIKKIVTAFEQGNNIAVRSGINENDIVIVEGILSVYDGAEVNIQEQEN